MLSRTTFEEFSKASEHHRYAVVIVEMLGDCYTPVNVFQYVAADATHAILLDNSDYHKHSPADAGVFIGLDPIAHFVASGCQVTITHHDQTKTSNFDDPFQQLREFYHHYRSSHSTPLAKLAGGIVGTISYDAVRLLEKISDRHNNTAHIPDLRFTCYSTYIIFDRRTGKMLLAKLVEVGADPQTSYTQACMALQQLQEKIIHSNLQAHSCHMENLAALSEMVIAPLSSAVADSDDATYSQMVVQAQTYIRQGDAFQIVISRQFQKPFSGNNFNIYRALKALNPSPYLYYIRFPEYSVIGASPEKLISLQQGIVEISPIAGSRPRGVTPEEDARLEQELLEDNKELAEHMMLVDLARNDVGKVCKPGTVSVLASPMINRFSHIMHLTSIVRGELCQGYDAFDVLAAGFPAGTLTGAPKIRAMDIIDEIEHSRRGLYGGAVCAIDQQGQMDSCILIRTAVIQDNVATVRAGAGIVLDSQPELEAAETRNKAQAVLLALELAEKMR